MDFEQHTHKADDEGHITVRTGEDVSAPYVSQTPEQHAPGTSFTPEVTNTPSWTDTSAGSGTPSIPEVPQPPSVTPAIAALESTTPTSPVPVVRVLSPVGVEYVFLTISLFAAATGLTWALLSLVNGKMSFTVLALPVALLLVSVPVFGLLLLHLKKLELRQPTLKLDPSKRRSTQFTQVTSFVVSLFTLVGVVFSIFAKLGGQSSVTIGKVLLDGLVLLVVFGGLLAYYWRDEHRG